MRRFGVLPFQGDDLAVLDRQREAPVLEFERALSEQFPSPAAERWRRRFVALGDRFEVVDGGDQLAGDAALLAHLPQQHFEQFDGRADIDAVAALALDLRQSLGVAREPAFDRRENLSAGARAL